MIRFKEFYDKEQPNGKYIAASQQANEFMSQNNVEYIDLKIFDSSHFLLIYKEKGDK